MGVIRLIPSFPGGKKKALTLSFDDGVAQDERLCKVLKKYGIACTFNLPGGFLDGEAFGPRNEDHIKEVQNRYLHPLFEVASHSYTHAMLDELPDSLQINQLIHDRKTLEEIFGGLVRGHAFASGQYNDTTIALLKDLGFAYARTVGETHTFDLPQDPYQTAGTCWFVNPELMDLADEFLNTAVKADREPLLFYMWGHAYEFDREGGWERLTAFCEKMSGHEDIWYATNIQIMDYLRDFGRLEAGAKGDSVYNPTATAVWVRMTFLTDCLRDYEFKVEPGETVLLKNLTEVDKR